MTEDQRWAYFVAVPALVCSLPVYLVAVGHYWCAREAFASALEFIDNCPLLPDVPVEDRLEAG